MLFTVVSKMYTLLSGLYKYMFQKDEYCVLILGLDNAGKTVGYSYTVKTGLVNVNSLAHSDGSVIFCVCVVCRLSVGTTFVPFRVLNC